jgi:hypothetical protein
MDNNTKLVTIVAIIGVLVIIGIYAIWDRAHRNDIVGCADGSHPTIDMRDFTTQYWTYSAKLEGSIGDKAKVSTELNPKTLQEISEALQQAREFKKYVVAGYNSCAITRAQYAQLGARFQSLDSLAREIDILVSKSSLSPDEHKKLAELISQYGDLARQMAKQ